MYMYTNVMYVINAGNARSVHQLAGGARAYTKWRNDRGRRHTVLPTRSLPPPNTKTTMKKTFPASGVCFVLVNCEFWPPAGDVLGADG